MSERSAEGVCLHRGQAFVSGFGGYRRVSMTAAAALQRRNS